MRSDHNNWTTEDEFLYLNTIGENIERRGSLSKTERLKRYLDTMDRRSEWDKLDARAIRERCQFLIDQAGKK